MNANEVLRIVDSLHRDKNIEKEVVFRAIESALVSAARKHFGDEADIEFIIDRESGQIAGRNGQEELDYEEVIGRIGAQTAKQVIIKTDNYRHPEPKIKLPPNASISLSVCLSVSCDARKTNYGLRP